MTGFSVLVDDPSAPSAGAYQTFGITEGGAVVAVRPDGYVGSVVALDDMKKLGEYLSGFLS